MEAPEVRYARSGDVSIAYQDVGDGPPVIVYSAGFISHLELNWSSPFYSDVCERFARMGRLLSFDKRGTGLSERSIGYGTLEERMDDIRAVMDAAGVERACLGGMSEGGPLSILFAATYPERVEKLVLYGTFARLVSGDGYDAGASLEQFELLIEFLQANWGSGDALAVFAQDAPDPDVARPILAKFERYTTTPEMVAHILRSYREIDVRPLLRSIRVPTLVMHAAGDPLVSVRNGRYLAEHIPGARYVEIDDAFHATWDRAKQNRVMDTVEEFFTGRTRATDYGDRVLTTVLFTDIVGSTPLAAKLGDARWKAMLDHHDEVVREELGQHRGREVKTTGDGFLASFDGPARAVRCAQSIVRRVQEFGLGVRAGVHTGECEQRDDDLSGIAVHIGARVMSVAGSGEVMTTRTVRDLVTGSGIEFESRGDHRLRGLDDNLEIFAAVS